jgi:hypothetical protein
VGGQWYLVTVSLTWDQPAGGSGLAGQVLDLLLGDEHMAGARVFGPVRNAPTEMYYRIDVLAESRDDAEARALAPAARIARELGGKTAVNDVQALTGAELGEHQSRIPTGDSAPDRG